MEVVNNTFISTTHVSLFRPGLEWKLTIGIIGGHDISLLCFPVIAVCEDPAPTRGVTVGPYNSTKVNSVIFYLCNQSGYTPSSSSSVCGEDGRCSPYPSRVVCKIVTTPAGTLGVCYTVVLLILNSTYLRQCQTTPLCVHYNMAS